ncbi:MAG: MjaI family restriction endonuclease [Deferribacteres bacterium]|nr:MjaI family restriction endonuclease [candidate division KSB1 bacterium]MCB9511287.1 MjaI family restriction endonuclease [Deferribacteres bacterium]
MKTKFRISNNEIAELLGIESVEFPKYTTQIVNLASQNAQATRPRVVGQMSDLMQEFSGKSIDEWENWYLQKHPNAIQDARKKIAQMIENFRNAMDEIDQQLIENWVRDLVILKTYIGLKFQKAILIKTAELLKSNYRIANSKDESKGVDGFIGDLPISIKPESYRAKKQLLENIDARFIFYDKVKTGIKVDISDVLADRE